MEARSLNDAATTNSDRKLDADAIIIGGGHRALLLEKDIHPRDQVGGSLTPSTNLVFDKIGFMDKMDDAGFIHKPGTGWNAPRSPLWKFSEIWLFEYPLPGTPRAYTYNVERRDGHLVDPSRARERREGPAGRQRQERAVRGRPRLGVQLACC